jgi:hypothetical protein
MDTGLAAGGYNATVTDSVGCAVTAPAIIAQPPPLVVTAQLVANTIQIVTSGGTPAYTYTWYPPVSTTSLATGLSAGTYTITVNDSNLCSNTEIITIDTTIVFSLANASINCGNPSYYTFDVMIASNYPTTFNNCDFYIQYSNSEFSGDNIYNNSFYISSGPDFQVDSACNDYYQIAESEYPGDTMVELQMGDPSFTSHCGTLLDTVPKVLFQVRLQIQNCQPGKVSFANLFYTNADFVHEDSVFSSRDSTVTDSLSSPNYHCAYLCNPYSCNYCCEYNDSGICVDSCPTTCYFTCYDTCYDTFSIVHYYNVYSYSDYSNRPYATIGFYVDSLIAPTCRDSIISYTNPINAGTNAKSVSPDISVIPDNSSILTITGTGFGSTKGNIQVSNADAGFNGKGSFAMITLDSADILSWSENLIKVKMPSYILSNLLATPGSGPFTVNNACDISYTDTLQINYNIENAYQPGTKEKARPDIIMAEETSTDTASIIWRCDTSISNHPGALACIRYAIYEWNCWTGVHWKLGADTILEIAKADSVSVIYFSNSNFADTTTLMETQQQIYGCYDDIDSVSFYDEADIEIKRNQYLPGGKAWSYDTTGAQTSVDSFYFFDKILHELGHAHGIGHINDTLSLMYWNTADYRPFITTGGTFPAPASLLGGLDMVYTSAANNPVTLPDHCADSILKPSTRMCIDPTLSVAYVPKNTFNLNLFPNPIDRGALTITYEVTKNSYIQFKILDCIGRVVMTLSNENKPPGNYSEQINIDALAGGVYLFTANINGEFQTIKFIKL